MDDQDQQVQEEVQKISINGQDYDPTEAQELIETGRKTREAEQKYNVTFDSIMPAYTKANERAKQADQFESELSEAKKTIQEFQSKQEQGTETKGDLDEAREAARKIGLLLNDDAKNTFLTKDQLDSYLNERDQKQQQVNAILKEANDLESKYDGSDGRPKFNKKVVLAYAQAYGSDSLEKAYQDMHADALQGWQQEQMNAQKKPGLKTLASQQGNKEPEAKPLTNDTIGDALSEALWGDK